MDDTLHHHHGDEADQAQHAERLFLAAALANVGSRSNLPGRVAAAMKTGLD